LRSAAERIRNTVIDAWKSDETWFDSAPMGMVQLDARGRLMRINDAMLREAMLPEDSLIGRTLSELLTDPDPLVSRRFMHMLLQPARAITRVSQGSRKGTSD